MRIFAHFSVCCFLLSVVSELKAATVPTAVLDAYVQENGSVSLAYMIEVAVSSDGVPMTFFRLSLPGSDFRMEQIRASRCDPSAGMAAEAGGTFAVEHEGALSVPLPVSRHPDPQNGTDILLDLNRHPISPGETATLCVQAVLTDFVAKDFFCPESAYVSVRPTLFGSSGETDLFVNIHLPAGIDPRTVLAQQEWPREQMQPWLPVSVDDGSAVLHWRKQGDLSEIYWIAVIFPARGIQTRKAYDGLQTEIRLVPKETLQMDAVIQNDGTVRLIYELEIDNSGSCKPVDTVQFVLPGRHEFLTASVDGQSIPAAPYPDIYDRLESRIGQNWYQAVNASLGSFRIEPGKTGTVRLEATVVQEIALLNPQRGTASLVLNPTASAAGVWQPGSQWTTRIHLPAGTPELEIQSGTIPFDRKEKKNGRFVLTWDQKDEPLPVEAAFPIGDIINLDWDINEPAHWLFVIQNHERFPQVRTVFFFALAPFVVFVAARVLLRSRQ